MAQPEYQRFMSSLWRGPIDPSIHAFLDIDAEPMLGVIDRIEGSDRVTPTAVVLRAIGYAFQQVPELNVVRRWGRLVPRGECSGWVYATDAQGNVTGRRVPEIDRASLPEIQRKVDVVGARRDPRRSAEMRRFYGWLARTPGPLRRAAIGVGGFLMHEARLRLPKTHFDRHGWGVAGVTNIGSFGIEEHVAIPIPPVSRHVALVSMSRIHSKPVAKGEAATTRRVLPLTVTLDHRVLVGVVAARLLAAFKQGLTDPALLGTFLRPARATRAA